jgi:hypothetical protein
MAKKLLWLILIIGIGIHFWVGQTQPFFGDENTTLQMAQNNSYQYLLVHQLEKIHPNGSILLTKVLLDLGAGVIGIRLFLSILFAFTLWPVYQIFKSLQLSKTQALMGTVLWSFAPYILLGSYLIRPYAFGIFFLVYSLYFTLNKHRWRSVIIDLFGVSFVSGYWVFVLAKYMAFGKKINGKAVIAMMTALGLNIFTVMNVEREISTHLDWMPQARVSDLATMLTTLLGITSPAYYEGYSSTPSSLLLTSGLLVLILAIILIYDRQKHALTNSQQYIQKLTLFIAFGYISIWVLSFLSHLPVFHVRQLFPIAIMFTLTLIYTALKSIKSNKVLMLLLVLPLLFFAFRRAITYTLHPIYPEHMIIKSISAY